MVNMYERLMALADYHDEYAFTNESDARRNREIADNYRRYALDWKKS